MGHPEQADVALRVERGQATEEELAALTVVLIALRAEGAGQSDDRSPRAGSRWWRHAGRYTAPLSWQ